MPQLAPILVRANVVSQLRYLRQLIEQLKAEPTTTLEPLQQYLRQSKIQTLEKAIADLKREHIFVIVDNT